MYSFQGDNKKTSHINCYLYFTEKEIGLILNSLNFSLQTLLPMCSDFANLWGNSWFVQQQISKKLVIFVKTFNQHFIFPVFC